MRVVDLLEETRGGPRRAGLGLVIVAFGLTAAAVAWEGLWVAGATAAWGLTVGAAGAMAMVRRRFLVSVREQSTSALDREHTGAPAIVFGASMVVIGALLLIGGFAALVGSGEAVSAIVLSRPGPMVTAIGVWATVVGATLVGSRWRYVEAPTTWWQRLPSQTVGVLTSAAGVLLLVLGVQALVAGSTWAMMFERVVALLARVFGG